MSIYDVILSLSEKNIFVIVLVLEIINFRFAAFLMQIEKQEPVSLAPKLDWRLLKHQRMKLKKF